MEDSEKVHVRWNRSVTFVFRNVYVTINVLYYISTNKCDA